MPLTVCSECIQYYARYRFTVKLRPLLQLTSLLTIYTRDIRASKAQWTEDQDQKRFSRTTRRGCPIQPQQKYAQDVDKSEHHISGCVSTFGAREGILLPAYTIHGITLPCERNHVMWCPYWRAFE
jgi:hypothetical protein